MPIGMSVPGMSDLGLGGMLQSQVKTETDEERKKRLMQMQSMGSASSLGLDALNMPRGTGGY